MGSRFGRNLRPFDAELLETVHQGSSQRRQQCRHNGQHLWQHRVEKLLAMARTTGAGGAQHGMAPTPGDAGRARMGGGRAGTAGGGRPRRRAGPVRRRPDAVLAALLRLGTGRRGPRPPCRAADHAGQDGAALRGSPPDAPRGGLGTVAGDRGVPARAAAACIASNLAWTVHRRLPRPIPGRGSTDLDRPGVETAPARRRLDAGAGQAAGPHRREHASHPVDRLRRRAHQRRRPPPSWAPRPSWSAGAARGHCVASRARQSC